MSVTLTYENTLSRVKIVGNGFAPTAATATIEHSTDQITWTPVRCATDAPIVSGVVTGYDYEFVSDVVNYYRVTTVVEPSFVSAGVAAHAVNTDVDPALPAGHVAGDLLLILAAHRASGSAVPNPPTGYSTVIDGSNMRLFAKIDNGVETTPHVTLTGGVANADVSAQMAAFRGLRLETVGASTILNSSAQDIIAPALTFDAITEGTRVWIGWKQDDWTSVGTVANGTEIGEPDTTTGDDQGIVWDYWINTTQAPFTVSSQRTFPVTGGASAISRGGTTIFRHANLVQTASITPSLDSVWIKSIGNPFLNRSFDCVANFSDVARGDRNGIFEVINRTLPVAVTDLRQSREFSIDVITRTTQEHDDFDLTMTLGDSIFLHTPASSPIPTLHAVVQRLNDHRPLLTKPCGNDWHVFTLPLREVAAPGNDVCGSTVTWQSVLNSYATWQAVVNGETSWFDLLQNIGSPADVIVS